jgi:hypothetical protein
MINNPATCKIHDVIFYLHAKNISGAYIRCELCAGKKCANMNEQMFMMIKVGGHLW